MKDYGFHPTIYSGLSDSQLYAMYRQKVFDQLTLEERTALLQETVNRDSLENWMNGTPLVKLEPMPQETYGMADKSSGTIYINKEMASVPTEYVSADGTIIIPDNNIELLNTAIHENTHMLNGQKADGVIQADSQEQLAALQANQGNIIPVKTNEVYKLGQQYLIPSGPDDYYIYYLQPEESIAFATAEDKTILIIQNLSLQYGTEPSFEAYLNSVQTNGYKATENAAAVKYQDPDIKDNIAAVLKNPMISGTASNPKTEQAVKQAMLNSYRLSSESTPKEGKNMSNSFNYKPVTLEEYNQSLRDSVNAYYTHAMQDPSMSQDEAIRETSNMAENYLNAVDEFAANQTAESANNAADISQTSDVGIDAGNTGPDAGEGTDGGIGGGDGPSL